MIDVNTYCDSIRRLVGEDYLKEALDNLLVLAKNSDLLHEVIMQSGRLSEVKRGIMRGTIDLDDANLTKNQIREAILSLTEDLETSIRENAAILKELNVSFEEVIRKMGLKLDELEVQRQKLLSSGKKYTCLWIDDDPSNDEIEFQVLSALNIECVIAKDPYKAYEIMKRNKPDVIVCNSLSRLKDNPDEGLEFCRYLSGIPAFKDVPVILHSISLMKRMRNGEKIDLSGNVKNNFQERDSLIIRDLVEEIVVNLK